jgi:hypothetical protein
MNDTWALFAQMRNLVKIAAPIGLKLKAESSAAQ